MAKCTLDLALPFPNFNTLLGPVSLKTRFLNRLKKVFSLYFYISLKIETFTDLRFKEIKISGKDTGWIGL